MEPKRLTRSSRDNIIAGICAGLGNYFNVDPIIFRIIFIVLAFSFVGIILYFILWIVIPDEDSYRIKRQYPASSDTAPNARANNIEDAQVIDENVPPQEEKETAQTSSKNANAYIIGICFIGLGLFFLIKKIWHVSFSHIWPVFLIAVGAIMIVNYFQKSKHNNYEEK